MVFFAFLIGGRGTLQHRPCTLENRFTQIFFNSGSTFWGVGRVLRPLARPFFVLVWVSHCPVASFWWGGRPGVGHGAPQAKEKRVGQRERRRHHGGFLGEKDEDKEKDKDKDKDKEKAKEKETDKETEKDTENQKDNDKEKKEQKKARERERQRERERERERQRERESIRERQREKGIEGGRESEI